MALLLPRLREPSVIPGFGLALGFTVAALNLIVLIPLAALVLRAARHESGLGELLTSDL